MDHNHGHDPEKDRKADSKIKWVCIGFFAVAAYFLILEHQAHLSGLLNYLPYLLLLACPLMHIFMHGGHGGHHHDKKPSDETTNEGGKK